MGKRSNFERVERDFYPTPPEAVLPLLQVTTPSTFAEPCCGGMHLISTLIKAGWTNPWASDITLGTDARDITATNLYNCAYIITNPPWSRPILHDLISHFKSLKPTWLLFDADWMHTRQSAELIQYCEMIVSVGRVKWIPNSPSVGKDNCCWYKFVNDKVETRFVGRAASLGQALELEDLGL